jgi:hypothetical protein
MIERYTRDIGQKYINILERLIILIVDEYYNIMDKFSLYDTTTDKYNIRRIFWTLMGVIVVFLLATPIYTAMCLYIYNNLR